MDANDLRVFRTTNSRDRLRHTDKNLSCLYKKYNILNLPSQVSQKTASILTLTLSRQKASRFMKKNLLRIKHKAFPTVGNLTKEAHIRNRNHSGIRYNMVSKRYTMQVKSK